jgi:hypothetical protein
MLYQSIYCPRLKSRCALTACSCLKYKTCPMVPVPDAVQRFENDAGAQGWDEKCSCDPSMTFQCPKQTVAAVSSQSLAKGSVFLVALNVDVPFPACSNLMNRLLLPLSTNGKPRNLSSNPSQDLGSICNPGRWFSPRGLA